MTTNPSTSHVLVKAENVQALYLALTERHQRVFFARSPNTFYEGLAAELILRPPYKLVRLALGLGMGVSGYNPTGKEVILSVAAGTHLAIVQPLGARAIEWETLPGNVHAFIPVTYTQPPNWQQLFPYANK